MRRMPNGTGGAQATVRQRRLASLLEAGSEVPHSFLEHVPASAVLALLVPGYGYRATMPLLHYSERALQWRGADVLRLELAYDVDPGYARADAPARRARLRGDAERALAAARSERSYDRIVLVGKSLGTLALTDLLTGPVAGADVGCVWLTPLLNDDGLRHAAQALRPPSLTVIGSADPLYDRSLLDELATATGGRALVVDGADHSLEIAGSLAATLEALRRYGAALESFLDDLGVALPGTRPA